MALELEVTIGGAALLSQSEVFRAATDNFRMWHKCTRSPRRVDLAAHGAAPEQNLAEKP
jgi:hypothetical protein